MSLTHPLRSLGRTPVFAVTAALTLTLGIGSVAAAFTIAHGVLLEPLAFGHSERLVSVGLHSAELQRIQQPPAIFKTYRRYAQRLTDLGFYRTGNANLTSDDGVAEPLRVTATWVTASTIKLLQVAPILGRSFTEDEDRAGGPDVAVISEAVWRTFFQSSQDVLGKRLIVNSIPRTIVGVMPRQFMFPAADTKLWLPARLDRDATAMGDFAYSGVGRLDANATPEEAQHELTTLLPKLAEVFPRLASGTATAEWLDQARPVVEVMSLRDEMTNGIARTLWMLAAAAGLVLFVALANVANLMMIRADARQHELAVREALGASRLRIATHFLGESVILSVFAGAAALFASWCAVRALAAFGPADVPRVAELHVGFATISFIVVVTILAAVICTVVPTIRIQRSTLSINLREGSRSHTAGSVRQRLRTLMSASQIAVALVALAGSALLMRTLQRMSHESRGFDESNLVTIWTQLPFTSYGDTASIVFYSRLVESVGQLRGVTSVGVTERLPLGDGETRQLSFRRADGSTLSLPIVVADSGYFATMTIPVLAGRGFQRIGAQRGGEIVLSRLAMEYMLLVSRPDLAIGRRVSLAPSGPAYSVVGVVGDVRDRDLATPPSPIVYVPHAVPVDKRTEPQARRTMALVVRTHNSQMEIVAAIRKSVRDLDPSVPIFNVETMRSIVSASTARLSLTLALMLAAAVITLALGAIGLYGVMAYTVALRTREFGIRIAVGADPHQLTRFVALSGMKVLGLGLAGGFVLYAVATPFLRAFLYGVTPADPITLVGATVVLVATAVFATWIPARRASRVDPNVALRAE